MSTIALKTALKQKQCICTFSYINIHMYIHMYVEDPKNLFKSKTPAAIVFIMCIICQQTYKIFKQDEIH